MSNINVIAKCRSHGIYSWESLSSFLHGQQANYNKKTLALQPSKFHNKSSTQGGDSLKKITDTLRKCMLQHTKHQVELFEMHCFTIFYHRLACVLFSNKVLKFHS